MSIDGVFFFQLLLICTLMKFNAVAAEMTFNSPLSEAFARHISQLNLFDYCINNC